MIKLKTKLKTKFSSGYPKNPVNFYKPTFMSKKLKFRNIVMKNKSLKKMLVKLSLLTVKYIIHSKSRNEGKPTFYLSHLDIYHLNSFVALHIIGSFGRQKDNVSLIFFDFSDVAVNISPPVIENSGICSDLLGGGSLVNDICFLFISVLKYNVQDINGFVNKDDMSLVHYTT